MQKPLEHVVEYVCEAHFKRVHDASNEKINIDLLEQNEFKRSMPATVRASGRIVFVARHKSSCEQAVNQSHSDLLYPYLTIEMIDHIVKVK